ncbi:MAG: hypothetical protein BWY63_01464 [Chloroflexi bacterium ADurb.Bin360]|nr:MAG: hypothetical protein BWY63_01464 [Chloroflexi bacterium ADurb.Bin360]
MAANVFFLHTDEVYAHGDIFGGECHTKAGSFQYASSLVNLVRIIAQHREIGDFGTGGQVLFDCEKLPCASLTR